MGPILHHNYAHMATIYAIELLFKVRHGCGQIHRHVIYTLGLLRGGTWLAACLGQAMNKLNLWQEKGGLLLQGAVGFAHIYA